VSKRPTFNILVLSAALVIGAGPYVVRAAGSRPGAPADPSGRALVDMQRVYAASESRATAETRIREQATKLFANFETMGGLRFLTQSELADYYDAVSAINQTEVETRKMDALKKANADRQETFQALATKANLTDAEKKQMQGLTANQQQHPVIMQQVQRVFQNRVNDLEVLENRKGMAEVRVAVSKLAKDQGIAEVFDTTAMVHAPVDLTEQAVKAVQKKK
jgi:hypothetical protein